MGSKGKNTLSIRKKDLSQNQKTPGLGTKELRFLHEATAGDTTITLSSLTTPPTALSGGFLQPTSSDLLGTGIKFFRNNLILTNGSGQIMRDHIDYQIADSGTINLATPALAGEVFEGKLKKSIEGPRVVDASTETTTGTLLTGETDFTLNFVYRPNANSSQQLGEISVALDGFPLFRTEDNVAPGPSVEGEYQEVDNGAGSSTVIRFESAGVDRNIRVHAIGALVERTNDSQQAVIESLAGQLDVIIPDLALAVGNPESKYQSAPNDVNLKQFGDQVNTNRRDILLKQDILKVAYLSQVETSGTGGGSSTAATYVKRTLNTEVDPDGIVSIASSVISFASTGEYVIEIHTHCDTGGGNSRTRLRNTTAGSTAIQGMSADLNSGIVSSGRVDAFGRITVATQTDDYEIQTIVSSSRGAAGMGPPISLGGDEVHVTMKITKLS